MKTRLFTRLLSLTFAVLLLIPPVPGIVQPLTVQSQETSAVALSEVERLAPESYWSHETPISSGPSDREPDVAVDAAGNGYAVWVANNYGSCRF